jgi:DNA-binding PadR family transcriptional regulator
VKIYTLTRSGRKRLRAEESAWQHATGIVARFMTLREDVS